MGKTKKTIKNINEFVDKYQFEIILILIFFSMLVLNLLTPLLADDYSYALSIEKNRLQNISDIFNYQIKHYFSWGGRTVAHSIAQIFLIFPKWIFSFMNSVVYTLFIVLIYKNIHGILNKKNDHFLLLTIHLSLFYLLPVFGEDTIWLIGSCNYLWTSTLILAFIWIYRKSLADNKKRNWPKCLGIFLFGIIVGWTNENTAVGLIIILILYYIFSENKKTAFQKLGLLGVIIGFIFLIAAPGNFVRAQQFEDGANIITKIITRVINITQTTVNYIHIPIALIVLLLSYYIYKNKKISNSFYIFCIGSFFSIYSMTLSPEFPERSWIGPILFIIIACGILIYNVLDKKIIKYFWVDVTIIMTILFIGDYITLAKDINVIQKVWNYRIEEINEGKKKGIKDFEFVPIYTQNLKSPYYGLSDLSKNKGSWPNDAIAYYYKIDSIKAYVEE